MRWTGIWWLVVWAALVHPAGAIEEADADLLIVGATESGWAAAIQAARMDVERIVIVHDGDWYGGQFTEQALACVDENKGAGKVGWGVDWHPMKRSFHRSGLFKELMDRIETLNTERYGSPMPGKPWHGPSTFRPAEAESVFREMIQPFVDSGQVRVFWRRFPVRADVVDNRLSGLWFAPVDGATQEELHIRARITIDASDWGEAIQVSGAAYECGPDPRSRYDEPSAPEDLSANPVNEMNPITWAMIVVEADEATAIPRPPRFDDRNYPRATHFSRAEFGGLEWDHPDPGRGSIPHWPPEGQASKRQLSVYSVRRIVDGFDSLDGRTSILLNYMNGQDYPLERLPQPVVDALEATEPGASEKNIVEMTRAQREIVFADAKGHALGVLYHLQNFVHERAEDRANSFRGFELSDEFGTPDRLPPKPYIREGLRLKAMYMMREQDARNTDGVTKEKARERFAQVIYPDGLFAWQFHYDFHRTGRTYLKDEGAGGPWIDYHKPNRHTKFVSDRAVFPLRSLIPETMDGLLGAQGNVGYSSIVSAAIRLHDQRIHIGQAAGATAAVSLREQVDPRDIVYEAGLLDAVRDGLCRDDMPGIPLLLWPWRDLPADHPAFVAVNRLMWRERLPLPDSTEVDFRPDDPAEEEWDGIAGQLLDFPPAGTRGETAIRMWRSKHGLPGPAPIRKQPGDFDADGIPDRDDARLFTPNEPISWTVREERVELTAESDGLVDESLDAHRRFDFGPPNGPPAAGFERDAGERFADDRGYGWSDDLSGSHRRRQMVAEGWRDSFVFTREVDAWECAVEAGRYQVVICVGDSGHPQPGQNVSVEGKRVLNNVDTAKGQWREVAAEVDVRDGRLTVEIGRDGGGSNTCLNWLVFRALED